jgi:hypothetical protein
MDAAFLSRDALCCLMTDYNITRVMRCTCREMSAATGNFPVYLNGATLTVSDRDGLILVYTGDMYDNEFIEKYAKINLYAGQKYTPWRKIKYNSSKHYYCASVHSDEPDDQIIKRVKTEHPRENLLIWRRPMYVLEHITRQWTY